MHDFDKEIDRFGTNCEKWERYKNRDIIPAWVADMDFESPKCLIDALKKRVDHGVFGYTGVSESVIKSVIDFIKREHNWEIKEEWLVWSHGVVVSMNLACRMLHVDDEVISTTPIYPHFVEAPKNANKKLTQVPMREVDDRWTIDFKEFESLINPSCKLFLFCNPYNPGGTVFTKDELEKISDICIKHNLIICSDEIHSDLVINKEAKHIPIASLNPKIRDQSITLIAPSKTFNIAGLKSSLAIIPNEVLRLRFTNEQKGVGGEINLLAIMATETLYRDGDVWLGELKSYLFKNLTLVREFVNNNKNLKMLSCDATYLAWIDCSSLEQKSPYRLFLKHGVKLSDGGGFGDAKFVRLNFGTNRKTLIQILKRMQKAVDSLV